MLKKSDEMKMNIFKNEQGGKGAAEILYILEPEDMAKSLTLFALISLKPNASIGYHQHNSESELFYIIQGSGEIICNGEHELITEGDAHVLNKGDYHSIENTGNEILKVIAIIIPKNE